MSAQWTVTGSGAFLIGNKKSNVKITGLTIGKIVDYGLKDSQNMGACMAPAAADTIAVNLKDMGRSPEDYDRIITGDLGYVGQSILLDLMRKRKIDLTQNHMDCGMTIFNQQDPGYAFRRQWMWLCSNDACSIYFTKAQNRRVETCIICSDRCTHVNCQLQ